MIMKHIPRLCRDFAGAIRDQFKATEEKIYCTNKCSSFISSPSGVIKCDFFFSFTWLICGIAVMFVSEARKRELEDLRYLKRVTTHPRENSYPATAEAPTRETCCQVYEQGLKGVSVYHRETVHGPDPAPSSSWSSGAPLSLMSVLPMEMLPEMGDTTFRGLGKFLNCWEATPRALLWLCR